MCLTSGGTEFRTEGAAQEKERRPNVLVLTGLNIKVMTSVCVRGERRLGWWVVGEDEWWKHT